MTDIEIVLACIGLGGAAGAAVVGGTINQLVLKKLEEFEDRWNSKVAQLDKSWEARCEQRHAIESAKRDTIIQMFEDLKTLIESRFDALGHRLGRLEDNVSTSNRKD